MKIKVQGSKVEVCDQSVREGSLSKGDLFAAKVYGKWKILTCRTVEEEEVKLMYGTDYAISFVFAEETPYVYDPFKVFKVLEIDGEEL